MKYIVLLRGINISGKNKIAMNLLKKELESLGYKNVIFWSFDLRNYRKSNWWMKTASCSIKDKITIRTANTIRKVYELASKSS